MSRIVRLALAPLLLLATALLGGCYYYPYAGGYYGGYPAAYPAYVPPVVVGGGYYRGRY